MFIRSFIWFTAIFSIQIEFKVFGYLLYKIKTDSEFAKKIIRSIKDNNSNYELIPIDSKKLNQKAVRPKKSTLNTKKIKKRQFS